MEENYIYKSLTNKIYDANMLYIIPKKLILLNTLQ